jgi:hypothetical protein
MAAALELYKETGSGIYINNLINNGLWTRINPYHPTVTYTMPSCSFTWGNFKNKIGF